MSSKRLTIALALLAASAAAAGCSRSKGTPEKRPAAATLRKDGYRGRLLAMTGDERSPVKVWDPAGKPVLDPYYAFEKKGLALIARGYSLRLEGGCFFSGGAEEYLGGGLRNSGGELTLSAYVNPAAASQREAGCIIGYGPGKGDLLFALMQEKDALTFRINAGPPRTVKLAKLDSAEPFHLVLAVGKKIAFYKNGKKAKEHRGVEGDFSAWRDGRLFFGNDGNGTHPWRGRIERAALYNRALGADEVAKAAGRVLKGIAEREPVPQVELTGVLLKRSKYRMPWGENTYREALSVCEYRVKKVVRGEYKEKKIRVAELMFVDRIFLTNSRKRIGGEYRLVVEEMADNPQMSKIERGDSLEMDIDAVLYVELSPLEALPKDRQPKPPKEK